MVRKDARNHSVQLRPGRTAANSPSGAIADSNVFTHNNSAQTLTASSGRYNNVVAMNYDNAGRLHDESLTISEQEKVTGVFIRRGGAALTLTSRGVNLLK